MRKACKECPWHNKSQHNDSWEGYTKSMEKIGRKKHACHMITNDVWGYKEEINESNICVGSIQKTS